VIPLFSLSLSYALSFCLSLSLPRARCSLNRATALVVQKLTRDVLACRAGGMRLLELRVSQPNWVEDFKGYMSLSRRVDKQNADVGKEKKVCE
jgi:hypothetical protein